MSAIDMKKMDQERQSRIFEVMMESFIKQWSPQDRREAAEFQAHLHSLVRQIYRDAQEPVLDRLTAAIATMPLFQHPIIPDGPAGVR